MTAQNDMRIEARSRRIVSSIRTHYLGPELMHPSRTEVEVWTDLILEMAKEIDRLRTALAETLPEDEVPQQEMQL